MAKAIRLHAVVAPAPGRGQRGRLVSQGILHSTTLTALTWTAESLLRRELWRRGAVVLALMLRDVAVGLVWTWALVWACSYGNVFSGRTPTSQSYGEFMSGAMLWIQLSFCLLTIVGQSAVLAKNRFHAAPDPTRPPGFLFCFRLLAKHTYCAFVLSVLAPVAMDIATDAASSSLRRVRLEFYVNCMLSAAFLTTVHLKRRQIFLSKTVEGQMMEADTKRKRTNSQPAHRARRIRATRFCRVFLMQNLPLLFSTFIAGLFVQVTSQIVIETQQALLLYATGSLTFKLLIQELARLVISSQKSTRDTRTIFLTVGLPTVLIDTQVRLAMQRLDSVRVTLSGSIALSLIEVVARASKVVFLRFQFRRYDERVARVRQQTRGLRSPSEVAVLDSQVDGWKKLHLRYHAAEVYADMSAEYIAIGSCAALLYFYWDHPYYKFSSVSHGDGQLHLNQPLMWVAQIGLEIVADYISVVVEMAGGIPFHEIHRFRAFITLLFLIIVLLNVQNSAMFFLIYDVSNGAGAEASRHGD